MTVPKESFMNPRITVDFLVDVSRTFGPENAEKNLNLVLENPA